MNNPHNTSTNQVDIIKASIKSLNSKLDTSKNPESKLMINNKLKAELIELDQLKLDNPEGFL